MEISHDQIASGCKITWESGAQELVGDRNNEKCQPRKCFQAKSKFFRAETRKYFPKKLLSQKFLSLR